MALAQVARETDGAVRAARRRLVDAVREAARSGMTQQQIAREIGRSQPEVSRLLRFHGTSPQARALMGHRRAVTALISAAGGRQVRVFGSLAGGVETADSDIDLLFRMTVPLSLMELGELEARVAELLGVPVDLVPESALQPLLRERILAEAVPL